MSGCLVVVSDLTFVRLVLAHCLLLKGHWEVGMVLIYTQFHLNCFILLNSKILFKCLFKTDIYYLVVSISQESSYDLAWFL